VTSFERVFEQPIILTLLSSEYEDHEDFDEERIKDSFDKWQIK
jgi:hypothetical protein